MVLIKDLITMIDDSYPKKIRESSIRALKTLTECANELQI